MKIGPKVYRCATALIALSGAIANAAEAPASKSEQSAVEIASKPLTLDEALQIAFKNNPDPKAASSQVEGKKGALDEAKARFRPSFTLGGSTVFQGPLTTMNTGTGSMAMQSSPSTSMRLSVSLPLDISNQLRFSSDIARIQFEGQYLALRSTCEALISGVKESYYSLLRMQDHAKVAQASVDDSKARLEVIKAKREEGMVPQYDVTSAEVELDNLTQDLYTAQKNVSLAQAALNVALGIDVNTPTQVVVADIPITIYNIDIPESIKQALVNRPDLQSALKSIEVAKKNVMLQQSGLMPQLSLSGGPVYDFNPSGFGTNNYSWSATISLSLPVFDGGQTRAKVRQAKANAETTKATLEKTKLSISSEVRQAALDVQTAALKTKTTEHAVKLAEDALSIAKDRYEAGIAVLVEVSNAQTELTKARSYRVDAIYDYAVAVAKLEKAMSTQPELKQLKLLVDSASIKEKAQS